LKFHIDRRVIDENKIKAIFIDDYIKNCAAAMKLGINILVLLYIYNKLHYRNYNIIKNLIDVKKY